MRCSRPRIWRQFVVPRGIGLFWLHHVIQTVMGWTVSHLHAFRKGRHGYTARAGRSRLG
ncbi:MAG: IS1096 element passenger TnpR family protein [Verrucomicrobiota bacterium]